MPVALFGSLFIVAVCYDLRPNLEQLSTTPPFWAKMSFPAALASIALIATARLSCPGQAVGCLSLLLIIPIVIVVIWGVSALWAAPPIDRGSLLLGRTWHTCTLNITFLSLPGFVLITQTVRALAPTRLRQTGAAIGLSSSALGAVAYCLHCPEMSPAFWAVWYVLGLAVPTGLGALLGPNVALVVP
ncbi:DUF1109 domain-containing protein (plasmid) [Paraburkholderia strydomiana]